MGSVGSRVTRFIAAGVISIALAFDVAMHEPGHRKDKWRPQVASRICAGERPSLRLRRCTDPIRSKKMRGPAWATRRTSKTRASIAQRELGCSFQLTRPLAHFQPDAMSIVATPARVELRRSAGATVRDKKSGP